MPLHDKGPVLAENAATGGDGDAPGITQDITLDDIQAIALSSRPVDERREELGAVRRTLETREHADRGHEFDPLLEEVRRMEDELTPADPPVEGDGSIGMDPSGRTDSMAPDEALDFLRSKRGEG